MDFRAAGANCQKPCHVAMASECCTGAGKVTEEAVWGKCGEDKVHGAWIFMAGAHGRSYSTFVPWIHPYER